MKAKGYPLSQFRQACTDEIDSGTTSKRTGPRGPPEFSMAYEQFMPGATAVGIAYKDGVVLGAERRITLGNFVRSKSGKRSSASPTALVRSAQEWCLICRTWSGRLPFTPS